MRRHGPRVATFPRALMVVTLALGLLALPCAAQTQSTGKVYRVGWVAMGPDSPSTSVFLEAFRQGMRERGWIEGRNLAIEARWGARDQARDLVAELNRLKVDVIVAVGPMVFGAQAAAGTTPVVFGFSGDPVEAKLVTSLPRPGANLTGITFLAYELVHKRLELLKDALPGLTRVAVLANVMHAGEQTELRESQAAARRLGLTLQYVPVRAAGDFPMAFEAITSERAQAIVAFPDVLIMSQAKNIAAFATKSRIPAISGWAEFAAAGKPYDLRAEPARVVAVHGDLRGQGPERRPAGGHSRRAGIQVRVGREYENRQGARPHDPAVATGTGGSGHRLTPRRLPRSQPCGH